MHTGPLRDRREPGIPDRDALLPLPEPNGPMSEAVIDVLRAEPGTRVHAPSSSGLDLLVDDDAQLALTCCYELAYQGFRDVDDRWELDPELLRVRADLETSFVRSVVDQVGDPAPTRGAAETLRALAGADGPSLSAWILEHGSLEQMREFCIHRSQYQLTEADPHTWVIPRLRGRAKSAFVTIQFDEYGNGRAGEMHAELFAETMRALALDDRYGAHLGRLPAATLATGNLVTMFGLHRRWRAAAVGHLALFEMTSVGPMGRYSDTLRRLGVPASARRFYDVHVAADAVHERIALDDMIGDFVDRNPDAEADVVFGARALSLVESRFAETLLRAWRNGDQALLTRAPGGAPSGRAVPPIPA
jgi:hypothetical protein